MDWLQVKSLLQVSETLIKTGNSSVVLEEKESLLQDLSTYMYHLCLGMDQKIPVGECRVCNAFNGIVVVTLHWYRLTFVREFKFEFYTYWLLIVIKFIRFWLKHSNWISYFWTWPVCNSLGLFVWKTAIVNFMYHSKHFITCIHNRKHYFWPGFAAKPVNLKICKYKNSVEYYIMTDH